MTDDCSFLRQTYKTDEPYKLVGWKIGVLLNHLLRYSQNLTSQMDAEGYVSTELALKFLNRYRELRQLVGPELQITLRHLLYILDPMNNERPPSYAFNSDYSKIRITHSWTITFMHGRTPDQLGALKVTEPPAFLYVARSRSDFRTILQAGGLDSSFDWNDDSGRYTRSHFPVGSVLEWHLGRTSHIKNCLLFKIDTRKMKDFTFYQVAGKNYLYLIDFVPLKATTIFYFSQQSDCWVTLIDQQPIGSEH